MKLEACFSAIAVGLFHVSVSVAMPRVISSLSLTREPVSMLFLITLPVARLLPILVMSLLLPAILV
jgi:hypothetical protein